MTWWWWIWETFPPNQQPWFPASYQGNPILSQIWDFLHVKYLADFSPVWVSPIESGAYRILKLRQAGTQGVRFEWVSFLSGPSRTGTWEYLSALACLDGPIQENILPTGSNVPLPLAKQAAYLFKTSEFLFNVWSKIYFRETREGWPLLTVDTDANGDLWRTTEEGPSLVG